MSETAWILLALGAWVMVIGGVWVCSRVVKHVDRAQSEVLAAGRRARFVDPPRRSEVS